MKNGQPKNCWLTSKQKQKNDIISAAIMSFIPDPDDPTIEYVVITEPDDNNDDIWDFVC